MIITDTHTAISLPSEVIPLIWRILGVGESPFRPPLNHEWVESRVRGRVRSANQDVAIDEIQGWFDREGEHWTLRDELRVPVAMLILHGVKQDINDGARSLGDDIAFWAIGSIHPDVAETVIRYQWSADEVGTFVSYVLETLNQLCQRNRVINPDRIAGLGAPGAEVTIDVTQKPDKLKTFQRMEECEWWLYPGVLSMVGLLIKLDPSLFVPMVEKVEHPVVQRWAAQCAAGYFTHANFQRPLEWITDRSPDAAVALAIVHTVENINHLDSEARRNSRSHKENVNLDETGSELVTGLLDKLATNEPIAAARWMIELLNYSVTAFPAYGSAEKPGRVERVEQLCIEKLSRLVSQYWSDELSRVLRAGLLADPFLPKALPIAYIAWEIRESWPERSVELACMILDEHERHVREALDGDRRFFYNSGNWSARDWIFGLGIALTLSGSDLDPLRWALDRCSALPLSVWDADDDPKRFRKADEAVGLYFSVAIHAVDILYSNGYSIDVRFAIALAEKLWDHRSFVERCAYSLPSDWDAAEYAARAAVALGKPTASWLLAQVSNPVVSPRILWALVDEGRSRTGQTTGNSTLQAKTIRSRFLRTASNRYGNSTGMNLDDLRYLARLWPLLGGAKEAEHTAMNILAFRRPKLQHTDQIAALELLAFAASLRRPTATVTGIMMSLYDELWPDNTPLGEVTQRENIDQLLSKSTNTAAT